MLPASRRRLEEMAGPDALVLDVGGWAEPFWRADWVIDLMPYETRGLYGEPPDPERERFRPETWVQRDICDRSPWPYEDDQFDIAVCSQTLEDVRDPVWVCSELVRVAKAGYIEVPSRLEEQSFGVHGPWAGWSHHRWLVDVAPDGVEFVFKPHHLHARRSAHLGEAAARALTADERVQFLFWEAGFSFQERVILTASELDSYLDELVEARGARLPPAGGTGRLRAVRARLGRRR